MSSKRYPEEFKIEAVKIGCLLRLFYFQCCHTSRYHYPHFYAWIKKYGPGSFTNKEQSDAQSEFHILHMEYMKLKQVTDGRDILKNRGVPCKTVRLRYDFIRDNSSR